MTLNACWIYTVFNNILEVIVSTFVIEILIIHQRARSADQRRFTFNFNEGEKAEMSNKKYRQQASGEKQYNVL